MLRGYVKFIVFGSACSQCAAVVNGRLNTNMQNVLTGAQVVKHKKASSPRQKEETQPQHLIEYEVDSVLKGNMLCL